MEAASVEITRSGWDAPCIFCKRLRAGNVSVEHILPESIGNKKLVLPPNVVCDKCNSYFGSHLDQTFIHAPGVDLARALVVSETKKGRAPRADYANGRVEGSKNGGP